MIRIFSAESRYTANHGWLKTSHSFSFADYYDPNNMSFGPLRVLNDDFVAAGNGFGAHPHREMEIVSIVLSGQLKHEDSTGGSEILHVGEIQRMTAGTGVVHSEYNPSNTEEVNFLQLWFMPEKNGLTPSYEQKAYDQKALKNHLLPVVSNRVQSEQVASIHQDLTLYLSELDAGKTLSFTQEANRKIFLFVIEGDLTLNEQTKLKKRDSARITDVTELKIDANTNAKLMLIDLP
ncbi:pirin family protein [Ammoniphilus resinae]|uniref:Redox-sensitive bicupin YhaK (Pirin superfamily) n=1 Tax=Ammoniphilus resinae TaxID=861532 RepID=A0ABS4GST2_9BACL|nr:pirin family protein [Ammoniphilus resinae]MBP1933082.1 redox-sensitive bicupin YhaK (pirin superfamily) [Ammoniphilus resinae]